MRPAHPVLLSLRYSHIHSPPGEGCDSVHRERVTKRPPPPQQKKAPHSDAACGHSSALQVRHRGPKITGLPPSQHRGLLCHQQLEVERTAPRSVPAVKYKDVLPSSQDDAEEGGRVVGRHTDLIFSVFLSTQNFVKTATKFGENELELLSCDRF